MVNIIKTAIITIVISFISGLLLDYYKNVAPRIICNVGKGTSLEVNGKKIFAYIINVINVSNKTIHDLTLNIQSPHSNLKVTDAKITKGLKFDSSIEDNILDISIPFLSKNDKFSVTVYVENQYTVNNNNKPVVVIRSPENFKRIDSARQNGILAILFNIPKSIKQGISKTIENPEEKTPNKKDDFTTVIDKSSCSDRSDRGNKEILYRNNKLSNSKKTMIVILPVILVVLIGFFGISYFKGMTNNTPASTVNTAIPGQSTDAAGSSAKTTVNKSAAESDGYKGTNAAAANSTRSTGTNAAIRGTTGNKSANAATRSSAENQGANAAYGASSENKGTNTSTETSSGNTNTNTSTRSSAENTVTNTATGTSSESKGSNTSSGASSGASSENKNANSAAKTSTGNTAN
ncbi:MAG: hypothetical protein ABF633_00430 [Clostridium sp.]|uniref:hypothetical protein n=1 Tax=Clostridium sp. TaxID=1506 RepID=UPI0039E963EC